MSSTKKAGEERHFRLQTLPSGLRHLTPRSNRAEFVELLTRWSTINKRTPAAIILPKSEDECQKAVQWAVTNDIAFTCKSGGMSLYSTVDEHGVVIDLSDYAGIEHDVGNKIATLVGGVQARTVGAELSKNGQFTPLPAAEPVGAIPFFLNGGNSVFVSRIGYGSDCIVSARMITADGRLINASAAENPDLLYAMRGAGQYFGLVTRLTVRTFTFEETTGNELGTVYTGPFVFPQERTADVCNALNRIISNKDFATNGVLLVGNMPPANKPVIAVFPRLFGEHASSHEKEAFKALYELEPTFTTGSNMPLAELARSQNALCAPGDYKQLVLAGLSSIEPARVAELVDLWQAMVTELPDACRSSFSVIWDSRLPKRPEFESANCMHDTQFWAGNFIWTAKAENVESLQGYLGNSFELLRRNQSVHQYVDFPNSLRDGPIERRHRGTERLKKLTNLKKQWDPEGRFTQQFL